MEENDDTNHIKDKKDAKKIADNLKNILENPYETSEEKLEGIVQEILAALNDNESFNKDIEEILAILNEQTTDLTLLQTKIILLIKKYLSKDKKTNIDLEMDEKLLTQDIAEVSHYLIQRKAVELKNANSKLPAGKDKYYGITAKSREDFKKVIKNFAVYQVYKVLNPKRIAGETRKENFAYNMILGGMKRAGHYAGGSKQEVAKYSPAFIKKLEAAHKSFKGGGRSM
jgi:hypothetical protein